MRILHVTPYMHPAAGGPPVVVENFVRETSSLGHASEIISTPLFCDNDQRNLLQRLNELAPTTLVSSSGILDIFRAKSQRCLSESVRDADIIHLHTIWHPINTIVRRECARY